MKGVEVSGSRVVLKIKNCANDPDELLLRLSTDGKRLRIQHEEFTATIKIKRLEHALLLAKVLWFSRWCRDSATRWAIGRGIEGFNRQERHDALTPVSEDET